MKNIILQFALVILAVGCSKNDNVVVQEPVNVKLLLQMSSVVSRADGDANALSGEGVYSLRVIIVDKQGSVVRNDYFPTISSDGNYFSGALTIFGVPTGRSDFYLIANEPSSMTPSLTREFAPGMSFSANNLLNKTISSGSMSNPYQPITGIRTGVELTNENTEITFNLTRTLCRWDVSVTNNALCPITMNSLDLSAIVPSQTYLFGRSPLTIPATNTYSTLSVAGTQFSNTNQGTIAPGATAVHSFYIFESSAGNGNYTISAQVNGIALPTQTLYWNTGSPIAKIERNSCVRMAVGITPTSMIILDYTVENWTDYTVTIPPFE